MPDTDSTSAPYTASLVTGGSARLGKAMALALAKRGISVAIHYNSNQSEAEQTAQEIRDLGVQAITLQANLLARNEAENLVARAADGLALRLDVLINNASIFKYDTIKSASEQSWDVNIDSNLRAPFILTQKFAQQAPKASSQADGEMIANACVVNMIDTRVRRLTAEYMTYTLGKMGLWAFTQTSARALGPHVRVNGIGPGSTMQGAEQSSEQFQSHRRGSILQRGANPRDIVQAMNYLLDASALTGQLLNIDGGYHLSA